MKECSVTVQGFIFMYVYTYIYILTLLLLLAVNIISLHCLLFFLGYREAFAAPAVFVNLMPFCN